MWEILDHNAFDEFGIGDVNPSIGHHMKTHHRTIFVRDFQVPIQHILKIKWIHAVRNLNHSHTTAIHQYRLFGNSCLVRAFCIWISNFLLPQIAIFFAWFSTYCRWSVRTQRVVVIMCTLPRLSENRHHFFSGPQPLLVLFVSLHLATVWCRTLDLSIKRQQLYHCSTGPTNVCQLMWHMCMPVACAMQCTGL